MNHLNRPLRYCLLILLASVYLVACRSESPAPNSGESTPGISLDITGTTCPSINVTSGDQITWTNQDQNVRLIQIRSSDGTIVFSAGDLQPGDSASFTISQAGNYIYICSSDQKSTGAITVKP